MISEIAGTTVIDESPNCLRQACHDCSLDSLLEIRVATQRGISAGAHT
ncbi:TPA: hypothetical protein HH295_05455 [Xanthomonas vasicola pv. zeae]|nr:hypothetical protein [Xanthomonas vasicola]MBV6743368.1 hypothetical protein [Xanthomonas vasicola pv. musacearum NCPPB 2251]MBV6746334.1 hypothetical protein [Xanthomonas vasicola pv. vasculorum NCPPB 890]MBV6891401.1 hypothetical protein [Xanthomonas vasicola pv. vasculorum]MBV7279629.1 hypothetical protein [Xanthomonas vasicola pv. musacearum]MBV7290961.1 hypothetical protein [Xanthomonas vasicola pv. musacearum]